jgi:hypothetical protein
MGALTSVRREKTHGKSLLRDLAAMNLEGPPDWSEHFEDYLNGDRTGLDDKFRRRDADGCGRDDRAPRKVVKGRRRVLSLKK